MSDGCDHNELVLASASDKEQTSRSSSLELDSLQEPATSGSSAVGIARESTRLSSSSLSAPKTQDSSSMADSIASNVSIGSNEPIHHQSNLSARPIAHNNHHHHHRRHFEHSTGSDSAASSASSSSASSLPSASTLQQVIESGTRLAQADGNMDLPVGEMDPSGLFLMGADTVTASATTSMQDAVLESGEVPAAAEAAFIEQPPLSEAGDELLLQQEPATFIITTDAPDYIDGVGERRCIQDELSLGSVIPGAPTGAVTVEELRLAAAAAVAAKRAALRSDVDDATTALVAPSADAHSEARLVYPSAEPDSCRLERSNSCSQAEAAASGQADPELARLSASFVGPVSAPPPNTSISHDNLAASFVDNNNSASVSSILLDPIQVQQCISAEHVNTSVLSDISAATTSDLPRLDIEPAASESTQHNLRYNNNQQQEQEFQKSSSSLRFFSSKLNTGSLWSLLSVGSATSTSALNEMPSPEQSRRDSSNQQLDKPVDSAGTGSAMSSFFSRQLQFAKRPQQTGGSSVSFDQQSSTNSSSSTSVQHHGGAHHEQNRLKYRFSIKYIGSAMLHKNFTMPMLEWIVKDIKRQTNRSLNQRQFTIPVRDIVFEIQANQLTAISNKDGHCIFVHPMHCVSKYAQLQHDPTCFSYIIRDNKDSPSFCHAFQAKSINRVHEIFNAIREITTRNQSLAPMPFRQAQLASLDQQQQQLLAASGGGANRLQKSASTDGQWKSLLAPSSESSLLQQKQMSKTPPVSSSSSANSMAAPSFHPSFPAVHSVQQEASINSVAAQAAAAAASCTQFENSYQFEVMFVKRVKLQCRRVPPSFVDDALETLKTFEPPKAQIKGVTKRIISASVDERQEYDENCQSPTPGSGPSQTMATINKSTASADADDKRRGSSASLRNHQSSSGSTGRKNSIEEGREEGRESKSCQQSPSKTNDKSTTATSQADKQRSIDCLKNIDYTIRAVKSGQAPAYFNDFSPYNTITSSDLNERIAAIPVVSSSVSLDHETRQKLARQVRETIMATAATIKKDVYASGDKLDSTGSSKVLDSLSCNAKSEVPTIDHDALAEATSDDVREGSQLRAERALKASLSDHQAQQKEREEQQTNEQRRSSAGASLQQSQSATVVGNNFDLFRRASSRQVVKNRTMLLLIGKDELCAISIDKHQMLFSKSFNSIVHCLQGINNKDHFGLICRDSGKINPQAESYAGFVFKCQSEKVVREIMGALKQVIYSSQHNYHGYNSPYNPFNYTSQVQQFVAPKQPSQRSPKLDRQQLSSDSINKPLTTASSQTLLTGQQSAAPTTTTTAGAPVSLAAKRGFSNPIEIEQALIQPRRALPSPTTAPALNLSQPVGAIPNQQAAKNPIKRMFCDDCPLYWFHRLCCDIESLPADASKAIILRRISSSLSEREQDEVYSKFSEFNVESIDEHNEIFMSILRQLNERKQAKHGQSQAHSDAIAKSLRLARQQSSDLLKQAATANFPASNFNKEPMSATVGIRAPDSSGHQRSGSSSGSLTNVISQTNPNQSLVDASSAAIDNLKRAKDSISVSIENMLKRRSSLKDGGADDNSRLNLPLRAGSFKGGTRELRAANSDLQRNSSMAQPSDDANSAAAQGFLNLKRSQSTSDYSQASSTTTTTATTASSWRDSLTRTINDDLTNPLVGFFRRRGSFAPSENGDQSNEQHDPRLDSKRTSTDSLSIAGQQQSENPRSQHHSPSRQPAEQQQQGANVLSAPRWIQPARALGQASPSSYLSGAFWKKSIFDKIHQPSQTSSTPLTTNSASQQTSEPEDRDETRTKTKKKTRDELRSLWRKAILEQITLLKMEKQNQKLQASSMEYNIQRIKLNYSDVPFGKEASRLWDKLLKQDATKKVQFFEVAKLVRVGVPKRRRGEIWMFLMNQYQLRHGTSFQPPPDSEFKGDADQTYRSLLSQLSTQQHEIFVDIGRTFPAHPYYSQYLSIGQLSLFNLLKAYSLLDKEVGYCQGLSFVAGILLLHVDSEDEAFELMRHLLFNFGLRKQYLPSMEALHLQLYQLTRLLRDYQYDIFQQFDKYDISPSLYAAPWFLTLFASQFPLGFVARLLDLIYLIGIEAIFRVSLNLLAYHRESLLKCSSLEAIMDFMRAELVKIDDKNLAKIFDDAIGLDLRNKLIEYEIEYSFYCAEDKARATSGASHHHYHHHHHHHHALTSSRQSANSSSSTVYSDVRRDNQDDESNPAAASSAAEADSSKTTVSNNATKQETSENGDNSMASEVADATATVIIQHLLANNHLRSLRTNYTY